jgi:predicted DNA-binding antitoxin AbrB/MazE fold protein
MKQVKVIILVSLFVSILSGCTLPQVIKPLRLYNLKDGNTIEVILHPTSLDHGMIASSNGQKEQFEGEYVILDRTTNWNGRWPGTIRSEAKTSNETPPSDLAELYGFGKNSDARPAGTGIIVGRDSTVIEIVFYRVSADLQVGDGVAKDNKGRYYRIFLSTEEGK